MRTKLKITEGIFPMPVLMVATYNEDNSVNVTADESVMVDGKIECNECCLGDNASKGHSCIESYRNT